MKTEFNFSNLLGTVYCRGNLLFTPDGTCLLSPVGNRVSCFDLVNNKSFTFPFAHRKNVSRIALSPNGNILLSVDQDGRAILTNVIRRTALYHFNFKSQVFDIKFAPDGKLFAVGAGRNVEVWKVPTVAQEREFAPFIKHRVYVGHFNSVTSITWSNDSRFFLTAAKDLTARIFSVDPIEGFDKTTLGGHKDYVVGAYFSKDQETIYTVSKDGALFTWKYMAKPKRDDEDDMEVDQETKERDERVRWRIAKKDYFNQTNAKVRCATFHPSSGLLVVGFTNGVFGLYEMPDFNMIHTLSVFQSDIDFVTINKTGEWLAFGASKLGQLLVWEWQSESYILKQQGHFDSMTSLTYTPDGQRIITTADDGKIKVWDAVSGFCIVTFTEHTAAVTACEFVRQGNVLFTASLDGSIRAWDLMRYRNFRTFTAPSRVQFTSLAVDPSGEVVCAGSQDAFDIYIWSVQTGQLLDTLSGHEGPVSSLAFSANGETLASGSWDHTVRLWSIFGRTQTSEPLQLQSDILSIAFRPDSKQLAIATLDGEMSFWAVEDALQEGHVDGRRDISGGRKFTDRRTAASSAAGKNFTCAVYSADGSCVLAGGNSKYICLYDVQSGGLLKKFTVSINIALSGTQEMLNSKNMTEAGPRDLLDDAGDASDLEDRIDRTLPGASRGDLSSRKTMPEVRVTSLAFSPSGRSFAAASTEGLLVYSLDDFYLFDPFDLDVDVTPSTTIDALKRKDYLRALVMAFRLNENYLIHQVYEGIPVHDVKLVVKDLPVAYLSRLMMFIARISEETPHLEFHLVWIEAILSLHGRHFRQRVQEYATEMRMIQKCIAGIQSELTKLADDDVYILDYVMSNPGKSKSNRGKATKALQITNGATDDGDDIEVDEEWHGIDD